MGHLADVRPFPFYEFFSFPGRFTPRHPGANCSLLRISDRYWRRVVLKLDATRYF